MRKLLYILTGALVTSFGLTSCLGNDNDKDYSDWRAKNDAYVKSLSTTEYEEYVPVWAPEHKVYMKWHNDRSETAGNLMPISTSNVSVTYTLKDIEGNTVQTSYRANGDSLYTSVCNENILGFWAGVTHMHVGDSVTMVIPYISGYGNVSTGGMKPFSTLIYDVRLVSVNDYERPSK